MDFEIEKMNSISRQYDETLHAALSVAIQALGEILQSPYPKSAKTADLALDNINRLFHSHREQQKPSKDVAI